MTKTIKLIAFFVANQLEIRGIKSFLKQRPVADSSSELFYQFSVDKYQYYFNYGIIVFSGYTEEEMERVIRGVDAYKRAPASHWLRDEFDIKFELNREMRFDFNEAVLGMVDAKVIRIAMFNLAQSIALDQYRSTTENLLAEVRVFTNRLERKGTIRVSRKNMRRFLGKALNTQNDIAENIYIFDAPDLVWDDEYLDKLHQGLIKHFDLRLRFSEVEYMLKIIEGNLRVFSEIINQRESTSLEIIIILLILVEVFDLVIFRLLN
jgi:required for meiotic nuclear division protein 1